MFLCVVQKIAFNYKAKVTYCNETPAPSSPCMSGNFEFVRFCQITVNNDSDRVLHAVCIYHGTLPTERQTIE